MKIEVLTKQNEAKWANFIKVSPDALLGHAVDWKDIIEKSYGHKSLYLLAEENNEVKGVLPAFIIRSWFFGKKIVSLPFLTDAGILSETATAQSALLGYLKESLKTCGCDSLEIRSQQEMLFDGGAVDSAYATFVLEVLADEKAMWGNLDKKVRNQIKKSWQCGLEVKAGNNYLREFYKLYQLNIKRLGTPCHSKKFFQNILKQFSEQSEILLAVFKNKPVAALFLVNFKDTVYNLWAGWDRKYREMNPNDFLYWEAIKRVSHQGFLHFDFGRSSKISGTSGFKKQWGVKEIPLFYYSFPASAKNSSANRAQFKMFSRVWAKLPAFLANCFGPAIRKYVP